MTDWFPVKSGVRQGDSLSPILFALFINDLATELNEAKHGVDIGNNMKLSILMYADDVVIISDSHENAQKQLDIMTRWCNTWGMIPNIKKSQVVHHRIPQRKRCTLPLMLDNKVMDYVENYKYLGCWINEHGNNTKTVEALTSAAGRSYGRIVGLIKQIGNMGYHTFCMLYETY